LAFEILAQPLGMAETPFNAERSPAVQALLTQSWMDMSPEPVKAAVLPTGVHV
jgi:hypothetical protein